MIQKHLVCVATVIVIAITLSTAVFSQELKLNDPLAISSIDTESFSFAYIGHAFGSDNDNSYWENNTVDYPATALLSNISLVKEYDFAIFGGDVIERCFPSVIDALEDSLLNRLNIPLFNAASPTDLCFNERYDSAKFIELVHGANLFLVISSEFEYLEKETSDWLSNTLNAAIDNELIKNVFIFTHRPMFLRYIPELQQAASLANTVIEQDESAAELFLNILDEFPKAQKNVYWLASDIGKNYPLVSHSYNENVQFIASGLYDNAYDHILNIELSSQAEVEITIVSLGDYKFSSVDNYSYEWLGEFIKEKTNTLDAVTYLKSIRSGSLEKLASIERLDDDVYQNKNVKGYIDWAAYNPQDNTLKVGGWAPIQAGEEIGRWFGYEGDSTLELDGFQTVVRQDLAQIFGIDQLRAGFELTFKVIDSQNNLLNGNLCFFSQTTTDGRFILPFNNNQQTFNCKIFPTN